MEYSYHSIHSICCYLSLLAFYPMVLYRAKIYWNKFSDTVLKFFSVIFSPFKTQQSDRSNRTKVYHDFILVPRATIFLFKEKHGTYSKHDITNSISRIQRWIPKRVSGTSNTIKLTIYGGKNGTRKFRFADFFFTGNCVVLVGRGEIFHCPRATINVRFLREKK